MNAELQDGTSPLKRNRGNGAREESGMLANADFDYIVVGAGTAGCIMANRLSADGRHRVLLLEAGGDDNWIWFHIPVGYLFAIGNPRADWMFRTAPEAGLNGRSLAYPRGKVIGGCSAINAMISMRARRRTMTIGASSACPAGAGMMRWRPSSAWKTISSARARCTAPTAAGASRRPA